MKKQLRSNLQVIGVLFGGILVNIPLPVIYFYGNLSVYIDSYYITSEGKENHHTGSLWITTLWTAFFTIGTVMSGVISHRLGARFTLLSGMMCFNLGIYLSFFTLRASFLSLHITLGVLTGIGSAFCFSMTLLYTAVWVQTRVGLCSAIVSSALGGGSVIFNIATTVFINPQHLEPNLNVDESKYFSQDEIINRVPYVFFVIGALTTGFHVIAFPLMINHPDFAKNSKIKRSTSKTLLSEHVYMDKSNNTYLKCTNSELYGINGTADTSSMTSDQQDAKKSENIEQIQNTDSNISKGQTKRIGITPLQAIQMKTFYLLALSMSFLTVGLIVGNTSYKQYGVLYISDDYFLANIGTGISVSVCLGRIIWGLTLDKFHATSILFCLAATQTILSVFWYFTLLVDKWFYFIWTLILQTNQTGIFIIYPMIVLKLFGSDHYVTILGMVDCFGVCVHFATPPIAEVILTELGWFWLFFLISGSSSLAFVLIICLPKSLNEDKQ